jgi:hypothetical protein
MLVDYAQAIAECNDVLRTEFFGVGDASAREADWKTAEIAEIRGGPRKLGRSAYLRDLRGSS